MNLHLLHGAQAANYHLLKVAQYCTFPMQVCICVKFSNQREK
jgi:hypothetical protein